MTGYVKMAFLSAAKLLLLAYAALPWHVVTNAQSCYNATTAINGKAFPSLIDATTEDLMSGMESGLFTSVDLVNVSNDATRTNPTETDSHTGVYCTHHGGQFDLAHGDPA
jgi:hypothetical protein